MMQARTPHQCSFLLSSLGRERRPRAFLPELLTFQSPPEKPPAFGRRRGDPSWMQDHSASRVRSSCPST